MRFPSTHGPGCDPANDGHCRIKRERLAELAEMADLLAQHFLDMARWLRTTPPGTITEMPVGNPEAYATGEPRCVDEHIEAVYAAAIVPDDGGER